MLSVPHANPDVIGMVRADQNRDKGFEGWRFGRSGRGKRSGEIN
jgi:hypothetical protein